MVLGRCELLGLVSLGIILGIILSGVLGCLVIPLGCQGWERGVRKIILIIHRHHLEQVPEPPPPPWLLP